MPQAVLALFYRERKRASDSIASLDRFRCGIFQILASRNLLSA
jgi:hypothetical protein